MAEIVVSISTITFNHELYIKDCLEGVVKQKTSFDYELLIHDDASNDNTQKIIEGYYKEYSSIIKPLYEETNQWVLGKKGSQVFNFPRAKGKYIALCEGDDYWTNPNKLQKQVDFMESHPEYSMCFHNAIEHFEDGSQPDHQFSTIEDRDYSGKELYEHWIVPTASVVMRREVIESEYYKRLSSNPNFCYGDILMWISCAKMGKIRGMSDVMSVYRRHSDSAVYSTPSLKHCLHNLEIYKSVGGEYKESARRLFFNDAVRIFNDGTERPEVKRKLFRECLYINPIKTVYQFFIKH